MFKNRKVSGPLGMLEALGIYPPDWLAYGPLPISICMALSYFPFAFLLFSNALNKIDIQLEEVATSLGAKTLTVWSKIIFCIWKFTHGLRITCKYRCFNREK